MKIVKIYKCRNQYLETFLLKFTVHFSALANWSCKHDWSRFEPGKSWSLASPLRAYGVQCFRLPPSSIIFDKGKADVLIGEVSALLSSECRSHNQSLVIHFSKVSQLRGGYRESSEWWFVQVKRIGVHLCSYICDSQTGANWLLW